MEKVPPVELPPLPEIVEQPNIPEFQVSACDTPLQFVSPAPEKAEAVRSVKFAVVESKLVIVPALAKKLVLVALTEVKFCNVLEPERSKLDKVVRPAVAVRVPEKEAAEEIVWPLISPEVIKPVLKAVENRLVEEAVVANKLVVVAFVVVLRVMLFRILAPVHVCEAWRRPTVPEVF